MNALTLGILFACVFGGEIAAQNAWISWMRSRHIAQAQKAYGVHVDDEIKSKVPSMGGVVFMLIGTGLLISAILQKNLNSVLFWSYPLLSALVGLTDDVLKYRRKSSEGLRSLQKFYLQAVTTGVWFLLLGMHGATPALLGSFSIGPLIWPIAFFFAVGVQNSVNVTDGLDGLAAGASVITFVTLFLLSLEPFGGAVVGAAIALGFLWHNRHPAKVFMGDAGAHYLAGLMASCAFFGSGGVLILILACMIFGLEMLSVVIQLIAIHKFHRKVFLMSPVHHHFQKLGWSENKVVFVFWTVHAVLCALGGVFVRFAFGGLF